MKDKLPSKIRKNERGIINLDHSSGGGTHWVCYKKIGKNINYYDSFGVEPAEEIIKYFEYPKNNILYNSTQEQKFDQIICGQLCLKFLLE